MGGVMIELHHGDCLEIMKSMPNNYVDLIITSPPYNLGKKHHTGNNYHLPYDDNLPEHEYQETQIKVLMECYRLLKDTGSMFYNHKNRIKNGKQISPYEWIFKTDFVIKQELVWFNGSQNFDKIRFYPMTERIYWLAKSEKTKLHNVINHHDLFNKSEWKPQGVNKEHTRAYPVELCSDIIKCFPDSKVVFDPYLGSGTTGVASIQQGKDFIGIEISEKYFQIAMERINGN
jgi:site-specific DNA-methyltransferase (adenine-specific)